jgi:hypothetical protein
MVEPRGEGETTVKFPFFRKFLYSIEVWVELDKHQLRLAPTGTQCST